jgi:formate hydrogenlyase transcriptional activator
MTQFDSNQTNENLQAEIAESKRIEQTLREQANLLSLTHDAIIVRDMNRVIRYWNRGAEELYGWDAEQAIGKVIYGLLKTVFPVPVEQIESEVMRTGRWEGELVHTKKDGTQVVVSSRWSLQQDDEGSPVGFLVTNNDLTERKRAEEALRASELNLRRIVDGIPGLVFTATAEGEVEFVNQQILDYSGRTFEELKRWTTTDLIHPDDLPKVIAAARRSIETGQPHTVEHRLRRADGVYRWFDFSRLAQRDSQGRIVRWYLLLSDIHERKRAEDALLRSEAYLAEAQRLTQTGSFACDISSRKVLYCSEELFRIFGFDPKEGLPTDKFLERIHPEDHDKVLEIYQKAVSQKADYTVDYRVVLPDGTVKYIQSIGHPVLDATGEVVECVGTAVDVTERKRAEEELRESEERFRNMADTAPVMIWISGVDKLCTYFNKQWLDFTGRTMQEELGNGWAQGVHPDDYERYLRTYTSAFDCREPFRMEYRLRRSDGQFRWIYVTDVPRFSPGGEFLGYIGSCVDITERKRAEEALKEALDRLSKKNRYETIISTVTSSVHRSINLEEVLENAVEAMSKNIDKVQHLAIYLIEGEEAVIKAYRGFPDRLIERVGRIPYPKGNIWKTIIEGKSIYCVDTDQDTAISTAGKEAGIKSYVSMPIFFEGKALGTLNISSLQKNAFDEEELKLLNIVSQQVETAINNAQQAEALRKALLEVDQLKNRLQAENIYLQEEIKTEYNYKEIVGENALLKNLLLNVEQVASTDTTVLIRGETGTGKELIARAIHNLSSRKDRPLVKVNCGAISAGLVESELFGHEKGAFTGALQKRVGRFELADGGTIFLDEVGELPLDIQVKLLHVLQEGEFERVGSSHSIKVDVRVIAATNRNLTEAVKAGSFRSDLFYRLNVFPIEVPPLRERKSDIQLLVNFFIAKFAKKLNKQIQGVSKETIDRLMSYPWPGNIRELQNVIERAVVVARGPIIHIDESMLRLDAGLQTSGSKTLEDVERSHILSVLEETNWVIKGKQGAASVLGLNPNTLWSRMRKHGIKKSERSK